MNRLFPQDIQKLNAAIAVNRKFRVDILEQATVVIRSGIVKRHMTNDELYHRVKRFSQEQKPGAFFPVNTLYKIFQLEQHQSNFRRFSDILTALGWEPKRKYIPGNVYARGYVYNGDSQSDDKTQEKDNPNGQVALHNDPW